MLPNMLRAVYEMLERKEDSQTNLQVRVECARAILAELIINLESVEKPPTVKSNKSKVESDWSFNLDKPGLDGKIISVEGDYPAVFETGGKQYKTTDCIGFTLRQLKTGAGPKFTEDKEGGIG